jgi:plastocyanin
MGIVPFPAEPIRIDRIVTEVSAVSVDSALWFNPCVAYSESMIPPGGLMITALKLAIAVCVVTTLAGCARTDSSASDTTPADTASGGTATPSPSTATTAEGATTGTPTGEPDLIHIVLREWSVSVSKSPIRAGRTTFHAMNEGKYRHAVEIEGGGQEWKTDPIALGGTATLIANLTPGTYKVYCPIVDTQGNHQERGMSTTLVVQ